MKSMSFAYYTRMNLCFINGISFCHLPLLSGKVTAATATVTTTTIVTVKLLSFVFNKTNTTRLHKVNSSKTKKQHKAYRCPTGGCMFNTYICTHSFYSPACPTPSEIIYFLFNSIRRNSVDSIIYCCVLVCASFRIGFIVHAKKPEFFFAWQISMKLSLK